jgi:hypothetical protein
MYCQHCGTNIDDSYNRCPSCGESPSGQHEQSQPGHQPVARYDADKAPTYLVYSILVTIFCCQIFGIIAIVFSAIAMGKNSSGDYPGAYEAAKTAKLWCWLGFGIGFVFVILYAALLVVGALATP